MDELPQRIRRGLLGAGIGSVVAGVLDFLLRVLGAQDAEMWVALAIIVASLRYWQVDAERKRRGS